MSTQRPQIAFPNLLQIKDAAVQLALQVVSKALGAVRDSAVPLRGTLNPDTRPVSLASSDVGLLFYATDFDRLYRWSGTAWEDGAGQVPRGVVVLTTLDPGVGWALCDGRQATMTTSSGGLTQVKTPVVALGDPAISAVYTSGLTAYVRL